MDILQHQLNERQKMKRVTSIGGIFFKSKDPEKIKEWYSKHLGLNTDKYGTSFEWRHAEEENKKGFTAWGVFDAKTKYMEPSKNEYMINYRVENLEVLVELLRKEGVTIVDEIEYYEYGKFVHILDCEDNKIELWEPNDEEYDKICGVRIK
jgi:predicted enzyme related to lactoylglutathione lyase